MAIITISITEEEKDALQKAVKCDNTTIPTMIKKIVFDYLENEYDIQVADQAHKQFISNSKTYQPAELKEILEL